MKKWVLLILLAVSVNAHAQRYDRWQAGQSEWIDGRAHSLNLQVARGVRLALVCGPKATDAIELRWIADAMPAEADIRDPRISFRVDERSAQRLTGVRYKTLEGGRPILSAPLPIGGDWAEAFKAGRQLVIQLGADIRVPSGSWFVPDKWEYEGGTETLTLSGFTAAYNSLPERCTKKPSGLIPFSTR